MSYKALNAEEEREAAGQPMFRFHLKDGTVFMVRRPNESLARLALKRALKYREAFNAKYGPMKDAMQRRLNEYRAKVLDEQRRRDAEAGLIPFNERTFWDL